MKYKINIIYTEKKQINKNMKKVNKNENKTKNNFRKQSTLNNKTKIKKNQ